MGPLVSLFRSIGEARPGFQDQGRSLTSVLPHMHTCMHVDSSVATSECDTYRPLGGQHCSQLPFTNDDMTRTHAAVCSR